MRILRINKELELCFLLIIPADYRACLTIWSITWIIGRSSESEPFLSLSHNVTSCSSVSTKTVLVRCFYQRLNCSHGANTINTTKDLLNCLWPWNSLSSCQITSQQELTDFCHQIRNIKCEAKTKNQTRNKLLIMTSVQSRWSLKLLVSSVNQETLWPSHELSLISSMSEQKAEARGEDPLSSRTSTSTC